MKKVYIAPVVLFATLASYGVTYGHSRDRQEHNRRPASQDAAKSSVPRASELKPGPEVNGIEGSDGTQQGKDREEANFQLNVRAVKAAEDSAYWASWTVGIGVISAIGVIGSIVFAGWQAILTRRAFFGQHRAVVRLRIARVRPIFPDQETTCDLVVINVGGSDTKEIGASLALGIFADSGNKLFGPEQYVHIPPLMASQDKVVEWRCGFPLPIEDVVHIQMGAARLFVAGSIIYKDRNGVARRTGVFRILDPNTLVFERVDKDHPRAHEDFEA